jgi:site-specific recombinase XerD
VRKAATAAAVVITVSTYYYYYYYYSYMEKGPSLDAEGPSDSKEIPRSLDPVLIQMYPHT